MPKAVQKASPPKLEDDEETELPPPPPPEVPHPSEIPKEFEVPQAPRLMTPERKMHTGNQRGERRSSREPSRRSEVLQPIPEQREVIQPS